MDDVVFRIEGLRKNHGGLRPLRINALSVCAGERTAIVGVDGPEAEVLVGLLTGAMLPDHGQVRIFGRATPCIVDADDWLRTLDRFGIVSARAVLLEELTLSQNIAMAFSLSIDPVPDAVRESVRRLSAEVGLASASLDRRLSEVPPVQKARCHLARALAADPSTLLLEHASALAPDDAATLGLTVAAVARGRRLALVALTADERFARAVADRVFALDGATGALRDISGWRRWWPKTFRE